MTNPFATSTPRPEPVSETIIAEAASRDYSAGAIEFPAFTMDIPDVTRHGSHGKGPSFPRDPEQRAIVEALMSFEPLKQAKAIGFTRTGDRAVDDKTDNLASKASLAARKFGIKAVRRTIVHPADAHKPSHEQRYVVALWRGVEEPKEA